MYRCNPEHKRGGSGARARPDKTLCDGTSVNTEQACRNLLEEAIRRGMISDQRRGDWPQNVWGVDPKGEVYEAKLTNLGTGEYHGFPLRGEDSFLQHLREEWEARAG